MSRSGQTSRKRQPLPSETGLPPLSPWRWAVLQAVLVVSCVSVGVGVESVLGVRVCDCNWWKAAECVLLPETLALALAVATAVIATLAVWLRHHSYQRVHAVECLAALVSVVIVSAALLVGWVGTSQQSPLVVTSLAVAASAALLARPLVLHRPARPVVSPPLAAALVLVACVSFCLACFVVSGEEHYVVVSGAVQPTAEAAATTSGLR